MKLNKLDHVMKHFNIFTYIYLKYFREKLNISLEGVYVFTTSKDSAASWWDVFDGMMWICSFVAVNIIYGYMF
jgi:hypothetical protein